MLKFETGKTYEARSACDYDCIFSFAVVRRTAKTITFVDRNQEVTRGVKQDAGGEEFCFPRGRFSMAPIIRAHKLSVGG